VKRGGEAGHYALKFSALMQKTKKGPNAACAEGP